MQRISDSTYTTDVNDYGWLITFDYVMNKGRVDITGASILQEQNDMKTELPLKMFTRSDLTDIELMIEVELEERRKRVRPHSNIDERSRQRIFGEL